MSYERGLAAIKLEMPDTIPHTEYVSHPKLIEHITGMTAADEKNPGDITREFYRKAELDFMWRTDSPPFENAPDSWMGSARYSEDQELREAVYPFADEEAVLSYDPAESIGVPDKGETFELFMANWKQTQDDYPMVVVPSGYYKTVFTWCITSFGWELFMASAMKDPARFDRVVEGFFQVSKPIYEALAEMPIEAIVSHDDIVWAAGPVFKPDWYREYVFPRLKKLWDPVREAGIPVLFCSDGNFDEFVDDLADAGADGFIFEPLTDLTYVAERYGQTHVIIGNADCRILQFGDKDDIYAEVKRCADIGRNLPGYFFAVGNHIPFNVPIDNAMYYLELVKELGRR